MLALMRFIRRYTLAPEPARDYFGLTAMPPTSSSLPSAEEELSLACADLVAHNNSLRLAVRDTRALLIDALHALDHGSPDVTREFLDRSIARLLSLTTS